MAADNASNLFLGIDLSTQQVKFIVINDELATVYEDAVKFDEDLPEFNTEGGVHLDKSSQSATSPTLLWVKAMDLALDRMKTSNKVDFSKIVAVSGAGQQHGSVYWKEGSEKLLSTLQGDKTLYEQFNANETFSVSNSPIWMDSSTSKQCAYLEKVIGGADVLARLTGSRGYERFTGNQIAKIFETMEDKYRNTERIGLVSSFGATIFLGKYAAIDEADGAGMNLMNIKTKTWVDNCLDACAPDLKSKLGDIVPSSQVLGNISDYMVDRYGFQLHCKIVAFTGDNPASLAGMRLKTGEVIVSLGTSDTAFLWLSEPEPALEGHIFGNPVDKDAYMALLCYKNGSLLRERIRDECANGSWNDFERILRSTPKGNDGNIGIYYDVAEITPSNAHGTFRFDVNDSEVGSFDKATEVRACVEGQFLAKRVHAEKLGFGLGSKSSRILATGGASSSKEILQVLSDVFNLPVYVLDVPNSAALGCAYRARHSWLGVDKVSFSDSLVNAPDFKCVAKPCTEASLIYDKMTERYKKIELAHVRNH